ncbi:MAG: hypothetical protein QNJ00_14815 [Woeseiaceae bacterium]|nr:hypothetical protein [Woeseiaceae bacterium]
MSDASSLVKRFDEAVPSYHGPHPQPTEFSIRKINEHFGIQLPQLWIELACGSKSFSSWFSSIGPDFESHSHIIRINSYYRRRRRTRRIPDHLVIVNLGFDYDCDCLDIDTLDKATGNYALRYWSPDRDNEMRWATFEDYVRKFIRHREDPTR